MTVCFLGLSFKANVGDVRNSPALDVVKQCAKLNIKVLVVDPHVDKLAIAAENLKVENFEEAINASDLIVVLVDHKEFSGKEAKIRLKKHKNLIDTRGLL